MAEEPNKKMDEMLKAYADERRKAPELYLHPATRRMLQGEVERTFGHQKPRRSPWDRIRSFWPQIAFGGALCCFFGIAILTLRQPSPRDSEGAVRESMQQELSTEALDPKLTKDRAASPNEGQINIQPETTSAEPLAETVRDSEQKVLNEKLTESDRADQLSVAQPLPTFAPPSVVPNSPPTPAPNNTVNFYDTQPEALKRKASVADADAVPQLSRARATRSVSPVSSGLKVDSKEETAATRTATDLAREQALAKEPAPEAESRFFRSEVKQQDESQSTRSTVSNRAGEAPGAVPSGASVAFGIPGPANPPTQPPAAPAQTPAFEMTNLGAARRLHFVQATNTTPVGVVPMFTSFQFEQAGNDVRVLDRDGSVYLGVIQPGDGLAGADAFGTVARQRVPELPRPTNTAAFELTVRGTNSIGKNVVLTGKLFERTNNSRGGVESLSLAPGVQGRASTRRPAAASEPRHLFIGNAIIGVTNQVPVRAVSREP